MLHQPRFELGTSYLAGADVFINSTTETYRNIFRNNLYSRRFLLRIVRPDVKLN